MTKSETWDVAMDAFKRINSLPDIAAQRIAFIQAIGDAEQRGEQRGREAAAKIADDSASWIMKARTIISAPARNTQDEKKSLSVFAERIAAAIRNPQEHQP